MKYGLKVFSINQNYITAAIDLFNAQVCDYIEIFAHPNSLEYLPLWMQLKHSGINFTVHAPHFKHGVNLSIPDKFEENCKILKDSFKFARELGADKLIFHPGIGGKVQETVRQINTILSNETLGNCEPVIENKPYYTVNYPDKSSVCTGHSPEEIKYIKENTNLGFCLDIGHAICAAAALQKNYKAFLEEFQQLEPSMYHISDNILDSVLDKHMNIGDGNYDFATIAQIITPNSKITIETDKTSMDNLDDFKDDRKKLGVFF